MKLHIFTIFCLLAYPSIFAGGCFPCSQKKFKLQHKIREEESDNEESLSISPTPIDYKITTEKEIRRVKRKLTKLLLKEKELAKDSSGELGDAVVFERVASHELNEFSSNYNLKLRVLRDSFKELRDGETPQ